MTKMYIRRNDKGICDHYAWPGAYPLFYITADNAVLCPNCVDSERELIDNADKNDKQWLVVGCEVNWEDPDMFCDHCNKRIESAYAEVELEDELTREREYECGRRLDK